MHPPMVPQNRSKTPHTTQPKKKKAHNSPELIIPEDAKITTDSLEARTKQFVEFLQEFLKKVADENDEKGKLAVASYGCG